MTFEEALLALALGDVKRVRSATCSSYEQNLVSLEYWVNQESDGSKMLERFLAANDWEEDYVDRRF